MKTTIPLDSLYEIAMHTDTGDLHTLPDDTVEQLLLKLAFMDETVRMSCSSTGYIQIHTPFGRFDLCLHPTEDRLQIDQVI